MLSCNSFISRLLWHDFGCVGLQGHALRISCAKPGLLREVVAEALGVSLEEATELINLGAVYVGSCSRNGSPTAQHDGEAGQKLVRATRYKDEAPQLLVQQASRMQSRRYTPTCLFAGSAWHCECAALLALSHVLSVGF